MSDNDVYKCKLSQEFAVAKVLLFQVGIILQNFYGPMVLQSYGSMINPAYTSRISKFGISCANIDIECARMPTIELKDNIPISCMEV